MDPRSRGGFTPAGPPTKPETTRQRTGTGNRHGASLLRADGRPLPLARRRIDRIVVIRDTGYRLKAADNACQACRDPAAFAFAKVAAQAGAWKPDMVIHVGDYHYRENPCPADKQALCGGSLWGYGWDVWNADFFGPGAPLLTTAPLVLARCNHENCNRAG